MYVMCVANAIPLLTKVGHVADENKDEAADLSLTEQLNIRVSALLRQRLAEAAEIVSLERGVRLDQTTLARELIVAGVDEIRARVA